MIFNSLEFFIFFTVVMAFYGVALKSERGRDLFLLGVNVLCGAISSVYAADFANRLISKIKEIRRGTL